jgi:hypothetical protein
MAGATVRPCDRCEHARDERHDTGHLDNLATLHIVDTPIAGHLPDLHGVVVRERADAANTDQGGAGRLDIPGSEENKKPKAA